MCEHLCETILRIPNNFTLEMQKQAQKLQRSLVNFKMFTGLINVQNASTCILKCLYYSCIFYRCSPSVAVLGELP